MKKNLVNLVIAAVAATFASASYAQSSVTLYGIADAGFTYTTNINGNNAFAMMSGNLQQSRWGLRGIENLGGGVKAVFDLESAFDTMNGSMSSTMFSRQSYAA